MTWIIIGLVLVLAIGPAMYLLPSAKDKRHMMLREAARKHGLMVQITTLPKLDPTDSERVTAGGRTLEPRRSCANYQLPVGQRLHGAGEVLLVKMPEAPTMPVNEVLPGWSLDSGSDSGFWRRLTAIPDVRGLMIAHLGALPDGTYGCALNERYVSCYWNEGVGADAASVAAIQAELEGFKTLLRTHFAAADEQDDNLGDGLKD